LDEERKQRNYVETESAWNDAFNPGTSAADTDGERRIDF
jgi:hypothetical protein